MPFHRPLLLIKYATFTRVCIFLSFIALDNLENTSYIDPQMDLTAESIQDQN